MHIDVNSSLEDSKHKFRQLKNFQLLDTMEARNNYYTHITYTRLILFALF